MEAPPETQSAPVASFRLASTIGAQLGETKRTPISLIQRAIVRVGADVVQGIVVDALAVEAAGGMTLEDNGRRRTPGGVFFKLLKDRITHDDRAAIFPKRDWREAKQKRRATQAAADITSAATPPPAQPTRIPLTTLPHLTGEIRTVKITLIGRPGPTKTMRDGYIMTSMQDTKQPSLPKGLPAPPSAPTVYTVYISPKHWNKVAEALQNPDDALIVDGWPSYDPMLEGLAVYVTNATTKELQRALRAQQAQT